MFTKEDVILVTGASSGIGQGVALHLNSLNATVLACGRNIQKLEETKEQCNFKENWHNYALDLLENIEILPSWIAEMRQKHGKLYGLVHCAGEGLMDSLQLYDLHNARKHFDLNFHVPMMLAKGFSDRRNYVKGGAMIFLSSASALYPEKGHLIYGAAKSALSTATQVISQEVATRGLRVHSIAPGIVDTPLQKKAEHEMGMQYRAEQLARYPLGFGEVDDIAYMVEFLLSKKARWITGQNYVLGGGCY